MRIAKWVWIIKADALAHETTLLGGRWNVGKRGIRVYLMLCVVEGVGYVVTGVVVLVGWFNVMLPVLAGTVCLNVLLSVLGWPLIVWGYIDFFLPGKPICANP